MPKISLIGAGSTVFARNLLGDILSFPELAGSRDQPVRHRPGAAGDLGGRRPQGRRGRGRQAHHRGHPGPRTQPRRRRLRHLHDPGGGLPTGDRHRLRGAQGVRPAPDDRRHAGHRRHHARAADHPGAPRHGPRHGAPLPRRDLPAVRQPHGDELLGPVAGEHDPHDRPVPQRAGHRRATRPRHRRPHRRDQLPLRRHQPHGLLPLVRAERRGPLPPPPTVSRRGGCRTGTACATTCSRASATS
jgi:hypothetical protein